MAVTLQEVRSWNASLSSHHESLTAVFVGATTGIGSETLLAFAKNIPKPKIYIIGRSERTSQPLLTSLQSVNPNGTYIFLESQISTLKNVTTVCNTIKSRESSINLLSLSPGYISFRGYEPTPDGLDTSMALRYYARIAFIQSLLPLLQTSASSGSFTRILNILAGGQESASLNTSDLSLQSPGAYGIGPAATHSATMLTLSLHRLALQNPSISFIHTFPGLVLTPTFQRGMNPWLKTVFKWILNPILGLFAMTQQVSGEWHLYYATAGRYPSAEEGGARAEQGRAETVEMGLDGKSGSGIYLVEAQKGRAVEGKAVKELEDKGAGEVVRRHTEEVFEKAGVV
ncbi:MAG: hypothetical protein M1820_007271 [Bogoriella megaspora]|nr:MAG: hypothetical protein M1820_007271 [Bogoriella megaspora]